MSNTWNITPSQLDKKHNNGEKMYIVDLRRDSDYRTGHIKGAINVYVDDEDLIIPEFLVKMIYRHMNKSMVILYCENGITSMRCVAKLRKQGLTVYNLYGGITEYKLLFNDI